MYSYVGEILVREQPKAHEKWEKAQQLRVVA